MKVKSYIIDGNKVYTTEKLEQYILLLPSTGTIPLPIDKYTGTEGIGTINIQVTKIQQAISSTNRKVIEDYCPKLCNFIRREKYIERENSS